MLDGTDLKVTRWQEAARDTWPRFYFGVEHGACVRLNRNEAPVSVRDDGQRTVMAEWIIHGEEYCEKFLRLLPQPPILYRVYWWFLSKIE